MITHQYLDQVIIWDYQQLVIIIPGKYDSMIYSVLIGISHTIMTITTCCELLRLVQISDDNYYTVNKPNFPSIGQT